MGGRVTADRRTAVAAVAVGLHLAAGAAHGVPHAAIPVELSTPQWAFVLLVGNAAPVVGVAALWRGRPRAGAALVALSMAGAFAFDGYFHYVAATPDNVAAASAGPWGAHFRATALALQASDLLGVAAGAWAWFDARTAG